MSLDLSELQPKDEETFDLGELMEETSKDVISNRRKELSSKITKLFHKIDALASQQRREKQALKKTTDRLNKALEQAEKLKNGDWSVVKELDKIEETETK